MAGTSPTPYYKEILDALAQPSRMNKDTLRRVRDVCVATDSKSVSNIRKTVKIMISANTSTETTFHGISEEIFYETMFRLLRIGQTKIMTELITWYKGVRGHLKPLEEAEGDNWAGMFSCFERPRLAASNAELTSDWAFIQRSLKFVVTEFDKPGSKKPGKQELHVKNAIASGIGRIFEVLFNIFHLFLERALLDLAKPGTSQPKVTLTGLEKKWNDFKNAALPGPGKPTRIVNVRVQSTVIETTPERGQFLDAFVPHKARRFEFEVYDRDQPIDMVDAKKLNLFDAIRVIERRLGFFLREFGFKPILNLQKGITPKQRRRMIRTALGRPRLSGDDDLARFACALYKDRLKPRRGAPNPSQQEAWRYIVELLAHYFATQASHTGFNLAEVSPYVDHPFPRVITGGQLHDCGVFAVRLVNVLLKLAACTAKEKNHKLEPTISFLILPLHVGLIVEMKNLQPLFAHNQLIVSPTAQQEKEFQDAWAKNASATDPTDLGQLRTKFLEDLGAQLFTRDIDLPLLRIPLVGVSTPPRPNQIDRAYQRLVVKNYGKLFSSNVDAEDNDFRGFDTVYLEALSLEQEWYNDHVLPLWNVTAFDLWQKTSRKNTLPSNPAVRKAYADKLLKAIQAVDKAYDDNVLLKKKEMSEKLRKNAGKILATKPPRITLSSRLGPSFRELGPVAIVRNHEIDARLGNKVSTPPFADREQHLPRLGG